MIRIENFVPPLKLVRQMRTTARNSRSRRMESRCLFSFPFFCTTQRHGLLFLFFTLFFLHFMD
jgi:hypothetical protein